MVAAKGSWMSVIDVLCHCMMMHGNRIDASLVLKHLQTLKSTAVCEGMVADGAKLVEGKVPVDGHKIQPCIEQ